MGKDNETQGSQQQAPPAAASTPGATGGAPPGNTAAGPGATGTSKGGARGKDVKAPPPAHQPQILQLTPEMFQQTVAAAVTAALAATQRPGDTTPATSTGLAAATNAPAPDLRCPA